jgi:hypothetical protein
LVSLDFPLRGLLHCLRVININPALITSDNPGQDGYIVGGDMTNEARHRHWLIHCCFWSLSGFLAQIRRWQDACPFHQPKSIGMSRNQFSSHRQGLDWFSVDPHKQAVSSSCSVRRCGSDGHICVLLVLSGCSTGLEPRTLFKGLMLSSPNACLIIATASLTLFSKICTKSDEHSLADALRNRIRPNTWSQIWYKENSMYTQQHEILYTDSQDMLVLSSTVTSRYYNCCRDSSISLGNYGYHLV